MPENNQNSVLDREQAMRQLLHHLFIILAALIVFCFACVAWFVNNTRVSGQAIQISAAGKPEFALATVGTRSKGAYDNLFGLSADLQTETIDGEVYHIASSNSSFCVSSDKNLNNFFDNADLRPGNRGSLDLYVICYTDNRELTLQPVLSAWYEDKDGNQKDAFAQDAEKDRKQAAEFLKGHILLFANMDDKGMYSGNIDLTNSIRIELATKTPNAEQDSRKFTWGEQVYSDDNTAVYRLPVYWVWPEQFGNFIYTGNSYNKNLFAQKDTADYSAFVTAMESNATFSRFFEVPSSYTGERPRIETITTPTGPTGFTEATKNYELYSGWYNAADEIIGDKISYIGLGFELTNNG